MSVEPKKMKKLDVDSVREDFPILSRMVNGHPLVYLDNAATTQRPRQVIETVSEFYTRYNANIHRAVHTLSYEATLKYEEAHRKVADFIGASSWREVVFTRNATESVNLVAYAWGLRNLSAGDEVVITIMEHHSNIVPWQMLRQMRGITLKYADITDEGILDLDHLRSLITDRTKLVGVIHASNSLGVINPVAAVVEEARKVGALVLVDAAQSLPHMPVDVRAMGCDFLVASGHKMLGPMGTGFLYARQELLEGMHPFLCGGDMIETVTVDGATWNELPWKFEAGTPNVAGGIGLGAAVDYLGRFDMEALLEHERSLLRHARQRLEELPWIECYSPAHGDTIGVLSFNVKGVHPHDVAGVLDESGIAVRSGHHCTQPLMKRLGLENTVRASFYLYNTAEEIDKLVDGIERAWRLFAK